MLAKWIDTEPRDWYGEMMENTINISEAASAKSLSQAIREVDTETGRKRVRDYLEAGPFPQFKVAKEAPILVRKIDKDGTETIGKFINRVFVPVEP